MTAFRPIPDYVPPTEGLWGKDFAWQSGDLREKGTKRIVTARRQRLFACCCEWRSLPKFEERYPNDTRPRDCIQTAELFCDGLATRQEMEVKRSAWAALTAATWEAAVAGGAAERLNQSSLYTLFLPMPFGESCRTTAAIAIADQFYAGDVTCGPILADCLEESGFDGPDYWLRLLREDSWVLSKGNVLIDAIIGKPGAVKTAGRGKAVGT